MGVWSSCNFLFSCLPSSCAWPWVPVHPAPLCLFGLRARNPPHLRPMAFIEQALCHGLVIKLCSMKAPEMLDEDSMKMCNPWSRSIIPCEELKLSPERWWERSSIFLNPALHNVKQNWVTGFIYIEKPSSTFGAIGSGWQSFSKLPPFVLCIFLRLLF
jgi:hypothetical protein